MKTYFSVSLFFFIISCINTVEPAMSSSAGSTGALMHSVQSPLNPSVQNIKNVPIDTPIANQKTFAKEVKSVDSQPDFEISVKDLTAADAVPLDKGSEPKAVNVDFSTYAINEGTVDEGVGPKKPETPGEVAEAAIIEQWPLPEGAKTVPSSIEQKTEMADKVGVPVAPVEPKPEELKKTVAEKERVELELTPPECLPSELDTTGLDAGGNWVIKRAFWAQGEKTYEKIMKTNNELYDVQVKFVQARNDVDKISDVEFRELGFEQGKIAELLDNLIEDTKNQRETQGALDEKEREFLKTLKEKQAKLEQLKLDLSAVDELEDALGIVMNNLNQQAGVCRNYEKQAWEHFKAIGKELNDKKARLLFYEMEGFLKTVEKNRDYLAGELWNYFNESAQQVKDHLSNIKNAVNELKQKGVDLAQEFEKFEKADQEKDQKEIAAEKELLEKERAEIAKKKKELDQGFMHKFAQLFVKAWSVIKGWFVKMYQVIASGLNAAIASILKLFGLRK